MHGLMRGGWKRGTAASGQERPEGTHAEALHHRASLLLYTKLDAHGAGVRRRHRAAAPGYYAGSTAGRSNSDG